MTRLIALLALLLAVPVAAQNALPSLSATDARALQESGELVLIDIRQPEEWRQTGMPEGSVGVSMAHPEGGQGFLRDVLATVNGDTTAAIALICRTGNRTSQVLPALQQWGFTRVYHIPEGMLGSSFGPGWLPSKLPIEACTDC
ncbi:MAG: rhodanese-like domain-containing protein [Wenzhouxiangella sp.]|nr:rhodanese-like domain-containing protein [Wenzhouxiangella sp.]